MHVHLPSFISNIQYIYIYIYIYIISHVIVLKHCCSRIVHFAQKNASLTVLFTSCELCFTFYFKISHMGLRGTGRVKVRCKDHSMATQAT
jgi:hypothetical protein